MNWLQCGIQSRSVIDFILCYFGEDILTYEWRSDQNTTYFWFLLLHILSETACRNTTLENQKYTRHLLWIETNLFFKSAEPTIMVLLYDLHLMSIWWPIFFLFENVLKRSMWVIKRSFLNATFSNINDG